VLFSEIFWLHASMVGGKLVFFIFVLYIHIYMYIYIYIYIYIFFFGNSFS